MKIEISQEELMRGVTIKYNQRGELIGKHSTLKIVGHEQEPKRCGLIPRGPVVDMPNGIMSYEMFKETYGREPNGTTEVIKDYEGKVASLSKFKEVQDK